MQPRRLVATVTAATALAAAVVALSAPPAVAAPAGCPRVEAVSVRGSTEPQDGRGGSIAGPLVRAVQQRSRHDVRTDDLVYPAAHPGPDYPASVAAGVAALRDRLRSVSATCPRTGFVIVGYSQGAQVVANVLDADPVPGGHAIRAVALFGDPTFNGSEPYDHGSYQRGRDGVDPRADGALSRFARRLRSSCRADDAICQAGVTGDGHFRYAGSLPTATEFILRKIGG